MMNEVVVTREGTREPTRLFQRLEQALTTHGYSVSARSDAQFQFVSSRGPLRLTVDASAMHVRFTFARGAPSAVLPDEGELERLVDGALGGGGTPSQPTRARGGERCFICATVIPAGATQCPLCGM